MRTALFSLGLIFSAVTATAQTPTVSLSLTSENGGADTRFTLSYTGTPTWANYENTSGSLGYYGDTFYSLPNSNFIFLTATPGSFLNSSLSNITGLNTGLSWTNTATGQFAELDLIRFNSNGTLTILRRGGDGFGGVLASPGEKIVLSGPTSVSFLSGLAFSNFNAGSWSGRNIPLSNWFPNYDIILNVGTAVPEPSTYGLILGGLVLAGAAIRRRIKK